MDRPTPQSEPLEPGKPPTPPTPPAPPSPSNVEPMPGTTSGSKGNGTDRSHEDDLPQSANGRPARRRMSRAAVARMKRARRRRRIILGVLVAMVTLMCALAGWFAVSAWIAKGEVEAAVAAVSQVKSAAESGDLEQTADGLDEFADHVQSAYRQTSQPVWALAGMTPRYGADITAIRETVHILEDVSNNGIPKITKMLRSVDLDRIGIKDGVISLGGLEDSSADLAAAHQSIVDAAARLNTVGPTTIPQLTSALEQGREQIGRLSALTDMASRVADVAPSMLGIGSGGNGSGGGNGGASRTYLILAQNNAELRATGGIASSWGTLTVTNGRLRLTDFATPPSDAVFGAGEVSGVLTADERNLFSTNMATDYQDLNFTPDFTRTGELASEIWERAGNGKVDGVISVDPVFLGRLLAVTGPVSLDSTITSAVLGLEQGDGGANTLTLSAENAAEVLLNRIYLTGAAQDEQDAFFSSAAAQVFDHVLHHLDGKGRSLMKVVREAADDGHLYVYSTHEAEQDRLDGTAVSGALISGDAPGNPVAGVYLNDGTMGKMDWYLDREVTSEYEKTYPSGARQYTLTISLTNTADAASIAAAPDLLRGYDSDRNPRHGEIETVIYVYAPAGGRLVDWSEDFDQIATHDGLTVGAKTVTLEPGERFTVTVHVLASASAGDTPLTVRQTPQTD